MSVILEGSAALHADTQLVIVTDDMALDVHFKGAQCHVQIWHFI